MPKAANKLTEKDLRQWRLIERFQEALAAGVTWAGTVRLGKEGTGPRVRVIQLLAEDESILLITTLPTTSTPPELIGQLYKHR